MLVQTRAWDLRVTEELIEWCLARMKQCNNRFYWMLSPAQSNQVLDILSTAYGLASVSVPIYETKALREQGHLLDFNWETGQLCLRHRTHIRCVFHGFYHYLDFVTGNRYCSDCRAHSRDTHNYLDQQETTSMANDFAHHCWNRLQGQAKQRQREAARVKKRGRAHTQNYLGQQDKSPLKRGRRR